MLFRVYSGFEAAFFKGVTGFFLDSLIMTRSRKIKLSAEIISKFLSAFSKLETDAGFFSV